MTEADACRAYAVMINTFCGTPDPLLTTELTARCIAISRSAEGATR